MNPTQGNPSAGNVAMKLAGQMGQARPAGQGLPSGQLVPTGGGKNPVADLAMVIKILDGYAGQSQDPDVVPIVRSIIILVSELIKDEQQKSMGGEQGQPMSGGLPQSPFGQPGGGMGGQGGMPPGLGGMMGGQ